ncbi:hypothetical protein GOARA_006_00230 [Gordonia araii NBRC 100433]|uniref:Uncharacterized protein n=1 Tax=Gordonia araii NBRC 100433 TaxID=1073574 RepID=G7GXD9_9ACTN|nr:hypothetical protein [Gordonia araii]NNG95950.1 DNA-binding protein [Gordonia araii NBRC 100433]GAB08264.1 hypothetical protein GOARA_006_00230 [Gordonia araii NBRC 100433]
MSDSRIQVGDVVIEDVDLDDENIEVIGPNGQPKRYTESDAERDAAEAAAHFERVRHLVPGGKSLSKDGRHSPRVQVVVAQETRDELDRRARAAQMSISKYTRRLIEDYLANTPQGA